MSAGKWMVHIDLACGSVEYMGEEPPAGALARVLGDLARAGLVPARGGGEAEGRAAWEGRGRLSGRSTASSRARA